MKRAWIAAGLAFLLVGNGWAVGEPEIDLRIIGTEHPSSFPSLLWISVKNPAYTPMTLNDQIASSQLIIDGKPFQWAGDSFNGPAGLPPKGEWSGCVPMSSYAPALTPGKHTMNWKFAGVTTKEISMRWNAPVDWRTGTLKTRQKEIHELADAIVNGLPRSCVEMWLMNKDGGISKQNQERYFLEPFFKMEISYSQNGPTGFTQEVVTHAPHVYKEAHFAD